MVHPRVQWFVVPFIAGMALASAATAQVRFAVESALSTHPVTWGDAQRLTLDLRGLSLEEALSAVARQSQVRIMYGEDVIGAKNRVTVRISDASLSGALDAVLRGTGLAARFVSEDAVLVKRAVSPIGIEVRQGALSGQVTDATTSQPLSGAAVLVVGTSLAAMTGSDGRFSIAGVPDGTHQLRVSLLGYVPLERQIVVTTGQTVTADFQLQAQALSLEGVVAVGYGTQRRRDVTGSIASVQAEEISHQSVTSVEQALQGRAPGVEVVQNSGAPGSEMTIRVRGGNSFLGGNNPLYVVDGLPVDDIGTSLNPQDVESMEILKDASATAIYGARGANGVVIITTKRGSVGTSRTEFDSYFGIQQPRRTLDLLNAQEFAQIANERARNDGVTPAFPDPTQLTVDTDWQDEVLRSAPLQSYTLSFSGGTEQTRYLVSSNLLEQDGIIAGSGYQRALFRVNLDQRMSSRFRVSTHLNLPRARRDVVPTDAEASVLLGALGAPPMVPVKDADRSYSDVSNFFFSTGTAENPLLLARDRMDRRTNGRLMGNISGQYDLGHGLQAKSLWGVDYTSGKSDYYIARTLRGGTPGGVGSVSTTENSSLVSENTLSLDHDFGADNRISATGGFTFQDDHFSSVFAGATDFVSDDLLNHNLGAGEIATQPRTDGYNARLVSWLGRVNYTLLDRYILTLSGRADGSSRFGSGNKWGYFPSAALAWRVSDEPFLAGSDLISNLKLRTSWGRTGNQDIGVYQSLQQIVPVTFVLGVTPAIGFAPRNIPNPDLKWETTEQFDAGLELGLWNERLRFTADAYRKNTSDLLALVQIAGSTGFTTSIQNVGATRNSGVELGLGTNLLDSPDLTWSIDASLSANRNRVVSTAGGVDVLAPAVDQLAGPASIIRQGEPLGAFYGFVENGLTDTGQISYRDVSGDGIINEQDRVIIGSPYPDFSYGLSTALRYRRLELNALLQGVQGVDVLNYNRFLYASSFNRGYNQIREVLDYWTPENPDAKYPRVSGTTSFRISDRFIEDASYLRLRNLRLSFDLPENWTRMARARTASLYVSAENLLTLTGYSWFDPEVSSFGGSNLQFGIDRNAYPTARTFLIGIRFGL